MDYYDQQAGVKTYQSTVNGLKFSIADDDDNAENFFKSASMQHFIVPEQQVLHDKTHKATSGLGEIDIVDTPKESQLKTPRATRKAAGSAKTPRATSPKKKGDDVKVEIES